MIFLGTVGAVTLGTVTPTPTVSAAALPTFLPVPDRGGFAPSQLRAGRNDA
jgi:hypothetical protein